MRKFSGLIDDNEDCKGWNAQGISALYEKVSKAWEPYGLLPSRLPEELQRKHRKFLTLRLLRQNPMAGTRTGSFKSGRNRAGLVACLVWCSGG